MELKLYDTLTREKRVFTPLDPERVRMYVCGPTVYDFAHIGNARPVIVFDVLFRLLRHIYGAEHVTYVRNVTDVDDKINARAAERGISIRELTEETYRNFKADVAALGCLEPTYEPRATEYVSKPAASVDMIRLIERLIANGNAYAAEGHVLFAVASMPDYGKLSKRSLDEMEAGARVEVAPYKRDPMDFVLWKPSPPELPGWDSPWGRGRPGWHIECSAMSAALLGETFDIHGGGIDLVFPHHENEIAQSRCAFHTPVMANFWMHNGFLQVEGEKMSKSLGNFVTIHELLEEWPGEVVRLNMLRSHYRQPMDWTVKGLEESSKILDGWYDIIGDETNSSGTPDPEFVAALRDDLNTPNALTQLHRIAGEVRGQASGVAQIERKWTLRASGMLIGLMAQSKRKFMQAYPRRTTVDETKITSLIEARKRARAAKDFKESDRIRDELAAMGVVLKDSKDGTTWEIAR
ncbi:MAG TPA: cysteine--tRNA ligase [Pseudolabrys sp.]|nr:cysteine--tRNA ligase [Pseudolabrys sp.]